MPHLWPFRWRERGLLPTGYESFGTGIRKRREELDRSESEDGGAEDVRGKVDVELWCSAGCGSFWVDGRVIPACRDEPGETLFDEDAKCPECGAGWCDKDTGEVAMRKRCDEEEAVDA
jgi:hypothetical protein